MALGAPSLTVPRSLASLWLLTCGVSTLAAPILMATVAQWHTVRMYLAQLGLVQTWISIACCLGLLLFSRRKHAETEEPWAQGALLIYVIAGLLTAIVINYGVLPQWLGHSSSLALTAQILSLLLVHACCAWRTWHSLWKFRKQP